MSDPGNSQNINVNVRDRRGGCGCGVVVAAIGALVALGYTFGALGGEYGLLWQIVAWIVLVLVVLGGLGAGLGVLDQRFGWGIFEPPEETADGPEQAETDDDNYGVERGED